jgi:hypothetical protein
MKPGEKATIECIESDRGCAKCIFFSDNSIGIRDNKSICAIKCLPEERDDKKKVIYILAQSPHASSQDDTWINQDDQHIAQSIWATVEYSGGKGKRMIAKIRSQGRREAAEAYCKGCSCMGPCDRQKTCVQYNAILGTASDENGETKHG